MPAARATARAPSRSPPPHPGGPAAIASARSPRAPAPPPPTDPAPPPARGGGPGGAGGGAPPRPARRQRRHERRVHSARERHQRAAQRPDPILELPLEAHRSSSSWAAASAALQIAAVGSPVAAATA